MLLACAPALRAGCGVLHTYDRAFSTPICKQGHIAHDYAFGAPLASKDTYRVEAFSCMLHAILR